MKTHKCKKGAVLLAAVTVFALGASLSANAQDADATGQKPKSPWERSASLGLTLTSGNSDTLLLTAKVQAARKKGENEWELGADGTYGENDGDKNNESLHGYSQYNRLFSERAYGYLRVDALHDAIADVEYRVTLGPGAGYYLIKKERTILSVEAGPGYVFERLGNDDNCYPTLRLAEKFEHKINDKTRIWQSAEILPEVEDFDNFIANGEIGVETALTEKSTLSAYVQDTYDNQPAPGRKENDVKLVSAIKFIF